MKNRIYRKSIPYGFSVLFIVILLVVGFIYSCGVKSMRKDQEASKKNIVSISEDSGSSYDDFEDDDEDEIESTRKNNSKKQKDKEDENVMTIINKEDSEKNYKSNKNKESKSEKGEAHFNSRGIKVVKVNCGSHDSKFRPGVMVRDNDTDLQDNARDLLFFKAKSGYWFFGRRGKKTMHDNLPLVKEMNLNLDMERIFEEEERHHKTVAPKIKLISLRMRDSDGNPILLKGKKKEIKNKLDLGIDVKIPRIRNKNIEASTTVCFISDKTGECKLLSNDGADLESMLQYGIYCMPKTAKQYRTSSIQKSDNGMDDIDGLKPISDLLTYREKKGRPSGNKAERDDERVYGMKFIKRYLVGGAIIIEMRINGKKPVMYESKILDLDDNYLIYCDSFTKYNYRRRR